jgi:hypothetical protein
MLWTTKRLGSYSGFVRYWEEKVIVKIFVCLLFPSLLFD